MATKSKTPGARGRAARAQRRRAARAQRRRAVQQQVRASATASATPGGDAVTLADDERQPCEVWTRVMGYHRPVDSFNAGKRAEHAERRFFKLPESERAL